MINQVEALATEISTAVLATTAALIIPMGIKHGAFTAQQPLNLAPHIRRAYHLVTRQTDRLSGEMKELQRAQESAGADHLDRIKRWAFSVQLSLYGLMMLIGAVDN